MRILLCFTDDLHSATFAMVASLSQRTEMEDVAGDKFAYWHAIEERWTGEEDLLVIEQDILIHDQVIPQLEACPGDWCTFAYPIFNSGQRLIQGLGCTRFTAALQQRVPAAEFLTDGKLRAISDGQDGVPWEFLDLVIANRLRTGHGLQPHVHEPDVRHLHDYSGPLEVGGPAWEGPGRDWRDTPLAVYHRDIPVIFDPARRPPAIQVYGAAMSRVDSAQDAAQLANNLAARYLHEDGTPRTVPAQLDVTRKPPMRFRTDKISHGYMPSYLRIAADIGLGGRVCEVGVFGGSSLHMWQALFPGGIVAGVDNDAGAHWPDETAVVVCAQDADDLPARLQAISPAGWDLIVDDASHDGKLSARTFELLWPLVVPGGFYVLEDWMVGLEGTAWHLQYGTSMLETAQSFLLLLDKPDSILESIEYRWGMAILRKRS